jgi:tetratricopeptide (TPR) repeat protein
MRSKISLISILLFFTVSIFGQTAAEADRLFQQNQFQKARDAYKVLLEKRPKDALYNYRFARCCYELKDDENAIKHFELSRNRFPLTNKYLGELYMKTYRFFQSVAAYDEYLKTIRETDKEFSLIQKAKKKAELAEKMIQRVDDIQIIDSVVVNKDHFLEFYKFSKDLGSLSAKPLKIGKKKDFKITYITQRQDRKLFSDSVHSQMDIFTSYKLLDDWSKPESVSDVINTKANENYPFLLSDGVTIYFASDGENSIGGYDLFISRFRPETNTYFQPENIGMPYNSIYNDYMMVVDDIHQVGWFATDRFQPEGKVIIFSFVPNTKKTIIQSEDSDYIRKSAQLLQFKKAKNLNKDTLSQTSDKVEESIHKILFVVNDSVVYTDIEQFKTEETRKLWNELKDLNSQLNKKRIQLEQLRLLYSQQEESRSELSPKILTLEKEISEMEDKVTTKTFELRNKENINLTK